MSQIPENFQSSYQDESFGSAIVRNFKEKPVPIIGLVGMFATCGYGFWRYKNKGFQNSTSLFLMQLRVGAQSVVIGVITLGMVYNMVTRYNAKKNKDEN